MREIEDKLNHFFEIYSIFDTPNFVYWCDQSYKRWLSDCCNGKMSYMDRSGRGDLERIMKGSKSVIVVGKYYGYKQRESGKALFSIGEDYHIQIKRELNEVGMAIKQHNPNARFRAVVDSAPIFEKALAEYGGLGWVGRNSLIINNKMGSFFNIGVLLVDVALEETKRVIIDGCGACRACIEACPMGAIRDDRMVDARCCVSYQTIELPRFAGGESVEINGWRYGCDDCQLACPYNR